MSIATRIQSMEEHISDAYDSLSKFGVAAPSNKNIENIANLVNEIYDNTPKIDYVSGTDLTLENTRVGKIDFKDTDNIEKIGFGTTSQDDEPTPDSPQDINVVTGGIGIKTSNKNLIENETFVQGNATSNTNTDRISCRNTKLKANTTYIFSSDINYSNFNVAIGTSLYKFPTQSKNIIYDSGWKSASFSFTTGDNDVYINIIIKKSNNSSITPNDVNTYHFQLEKGSAATSYVAHVGNNFEINLGKNLSSLQSMSTTGGGYINKGCGEVGKVKKGKMYTLSFLNNSTSTNNINIRNYSDNTTYTTETYGNLIANSRTSFTFIATHDGTISFNGSFGNVDIINIFTEFQLELNSAATPYEPYKTPIELCKIGTYQDYIYKNSKNWYLHKEIEKIVLNGTESWVLDGALTNTNRFRTSITSYNIRNITLKYNGFSNQLQIINAYSDESEHLYTYKPSSIMNLYVFYTKTRCADLAGLQTWLSANNLIIYGILNTPTEIPITNENLIAQLDAWYNAQSMDDTTYITVDGDLPMQLKLRALKK